MKLKVKAHFIVFLMLSVVPFSLTGAEISLTATYDGNNRLTGVTYDNGITVNYTYDPLGNRLRKTVVIPPTLDTDSDGVFDLSDACPFEANDAVGDACIHNDCSDLSLEDVVGNACVHNDCADLSLEDVVGAACVHNDCSDLSLEDSVGAVCVHNDCADLSLEDSIGNACIHNDCADLSIEDTVGAVCIHNDCVDLSPEDVVGDSCIHNDCADLSLEDVVGVACNHDEDTDGIIDTADTCPFDAHHDEVGDPCDHDEDNDGADDDTDLFPTDATETVDFDLDGTGNNADLDDDNDNIPDISDPYPYQLNRAPELQSIGDKTLGENEFLTITLAAGDLDGDVLTSTVENLPEGATFDGATGIFSWTPTYEQSGSYLVRFMVSDGYLTDGEELTLAVNHVNRVPVLDPIADQAMGEGVGLTFEVTGSDPDSDDLTFTAQALPQGATFEDRRFTWTPTRLQQGTYSVTFEVSDGEFSDRQTITITVVDQSAPSEISDFIAEEGENHEEIELTWTNPTEADWRGVRILRKVGSEIASLLDGETVYEGTGTSFIDHELDQHTDYFYRAFTFDDAGNFSVGMNADPESLKPRDLDADDDGLLDEVDACPLDANHDEIGNPCIHNDCADLSLEDAVGNICVHNDCEDLSLEDTVGNACIHNDCSDLSLEDVVGTACNHDEDNDLIIDGIDICPFDANHDAVGNPCNHDEDDDGVDDVNDLFPTDATETVDFDLDGTGNNADLDDDSDGIPDVSDRFPNRQNEPPVITPIGDQFVAEGETLTVAIEAIDPDGDPFTVAAQNLPVGSVFDAETRIMTWSPGFDQSGMYANVQVAASDGYLETLRSFSIAVNHVNRPPALASVAPIIVDEASATSFLLEGSDPDGDDLIYRANDLPTGATLNTSTQQFTWTPNRRQQGIWRMTFEVSDGELADRKEIVITVRDEDPPSDVTAFTAGEGTNHGEIDLSWTNPTDEDFEGVRLVRKTDRPIAHALDGELLIEGQLVSFTDSNLDEHHTYFYKVFAFDERRNLSDGIGTASGVRPRDTGAPALVSDVEITTIDGGLGITWVLPTDLDFEAATLFRDGDEIYDGDADSFDDVLTGTARHCYHLATRDIVDNISDETDDLCYLFRDQDNDRRDDAIDTDDDGDGIEDESDDFPYDAAETTDTDDDGLGDQADGDDDNDDIPDGTDSFPLAVNHAPTLQTLGDLAVKENESLIIALAATDPDGDPLTYIADKLPKGATFSSEGVLTWTPDFDQAGKYTGVVLSVTDGYLSDSLSVILSVNNNNRAPILDPIGSHVSGEDVELSVPLRASDPDHDRLTFAILDGPEGSWIDATSETLHWKVPLTGISEHNFEISVTDGELTDRQSLSVFIRDEVAPPEVDDFVAEVNAKDVSLHWSLPPSDELAGIVLTRREMESGEEQTLARDLLETFVDGAIEFEKTYSYTIATFDERGNLSEGVTASPLLVRLVSPLAPQVAEPAQEPGATAPTYQLVEIGGCSLILQPEQH